MNKLLDKTRNNAAKAAAIAFLCLVNAAAWAQTTSGVDTSAAEAEITGIKVSVAAIGAAVFSVFVAIKLWKWLRRAL